MNEYTYSIIMQHLSTKEKNPYDYENHFILKRAIEPPNSLS